MASWRPFGASNAPKTCLWCGRKLRFKALQSHTEITQVLLDPKNEKDQYLIEEGQITRKRYKTIIDERDTIGGDYRDGFFCGLRCGYEFGVRMAQLDKRLKMKEEQ